MASSGKLRPWSRDKCIICREDIDKKLDISGDLEGSESRSPEPNPFFQEALLEDDFGFQGSLSEDNRKRERGNQVGIGARIETGKLSKLQSAFKVFCKLLGEDGEGCKPGGDVEVIFREFSQPPPCCQQCLEALYEIARLELVIQGAKISQGERVKTLKQSVMGTPTQNWNSVGDHENETLLTSHDEVLWSRFREQLITCVDQRAEISSGSPPKQDSAVRKRKSPSTSFSMKQKNRKLAKSSKMEESEEVINSKVTTPQLPHPQIPAINEIKREPLDNLEKANGENVRPSQTPTTASLPAKNKMGREAYYGTMVYRVAENLFLFKATVIQFCPTGQQFFCQEPGCSFVAKGSDYAAFQWVKKHILKRHYFEWNYDEKARSCPVCDAPYRNLAGTGRRFKSHMSSTHIGRPATVICETCGRFLLSQDYHIHVWTHKSKEEKVAAIKSGEEIPHQLRRRVAKRKSDPWYPLLFPEEAASNPEPAPEVTPPTRGKEKKVKVKKVKRGAIGRVKRKEDEPQMPTNEIIYRVNEAVLLYKRTLIGVKDGGTTLSCLDPECDQGPQGGRYSTLVEQLGVDYYAVFAAIKAHIKRCHLRTCPAEEDPSADSSPLKKWGEPPPKQMACPLCSVSVTTDKFHRTVGASLRYHLLKSHSSSLKIICDCCWRPFKNYPASYREHVWFHKNAQEKEEDEQGPPVRLLRGFTKDMINDSFLLLEDHRLLLHLFTFVKYSRSEEGSCFICQEADCSESFEGGTVPHETFERLREHVETCHFSHLEYSTQPRSCPLCHLNYRDGRFMRKHLIQVHSSQSVCTHCWQPVWYHRHNRYLEEHIKLHHPPGPSTELLPPQNQDPTPAASDPKAPILPRKKKKIYPRDKKYVCGQCGKSYSAPLHLRLHQDSHLDKHLRKKYDCPQPQCPDKFLSLRAVRNHVERKHQPELQGKRRECPHCKKQFNCKDTTLYNTHLRTHTNDKPFVCDLCGAQFHSQASLTCHQMCVHVESRIQCEFCAKSYKTVKNLKSHQKQAHGHRF